MCFFAFKKSAKKSVRANFFVDSLHIKMYICVRNNTQVCVEKKGKKMKMVVISQKGTGTGTIHDIQSEHYDRIVFFEDDHAYAIVLADHYNDDDDRTYKTAQDVIDASSELSSYSHMILDDRGNTYVSIDNRLMLVDSCTYHVDYV